MRRLLIVLLLTVGTFAFATEGEWNYSGENFSISFLDGETTWSTFESYFEGCNIVEEITQFELPSFQGFSIVVEMRNQITKVWVFEGYFVSYFIILKEC